MKAYLQAVKKIMNKFCMTKVVQMGRAQNRHADSLTTLALSKTEEVPRLIKVELIMEPSISVANNVSTTEVDVAMISATKPCWMDPIINFLAEDRVLNDKRRLTRFVEWLLSIGCMQIASYTGGLLGDRTFHACTLRK